MFGNTKKEDPSGSNGKATVHTSSSNSINSVGQGTHVEGTVNADGDIRIDGTLTGTLNCKGRVIIGSTGKVDGKLDCKTAIIEGGFKGNLKVSEVLSVKESARIDGDINTGQLIVQAGAVFNVNCIMGGQKIVEPSLSKVKA